MDILEVSSGTIGVWEINLQDKDGNPISYDPTDILAAQIWAGDDTIDLGDPIANWIDPLLGRVQIAVPEPLTGALEPARYLMRLIINTHSGAIEGWRGWLDILWSPGLSRTLPTYCTYHDLILYAPQIQRLQLESDQAGFTSARALARRWLDAQIQGAWRGNKMISYTSPKLMSYYIYINNDVYLQSCLDADCLQLTPRVIETVAKKAIGYIYDSAISGDSKNEGEYRKLGNKFSRDASQLVKTLVIGLTSPTDPQEEHGSLRKYASLICDMTKRDTRF